MDYHDRLLTVDELAKFLDLSFADTGARLLSCRRAISLAFRCSPVPESIETIQAHLTRPTSEIGHARGKG
jgi:hypothetical protein